MSRMLIVRGLPGSGKSTYVKNNYNGIFVMETDMFNIVNGQYLWNIERSKCAINLIQNFCEQLWKSKNKPDFCLTGVFGRFTSFSDYITDAILKYNYDVYVKTLTTQYKNIHNVPENTLLMFKQNFLSENNLKNILFKFPKLAGKIHFEEMPKLNWNFNGNNDSEQECNNYEGEG